MAWFLMAILIMAVLYIFLCLGDDDDFGDDEGDWPQ